MPIKKELIRRAEGVAPPPGIWQMTEEDIQLAKDSFDTKKERKKASKIINYLRNIAPLYVNQAGLFGIYHKGSDEVVNPADRPPEPIILKASLSEYLKYFMSKNNNEKRPMDAKLFILHATDKHVRKKLLNYDKVLKVVDETTSSRINKKFWHKIY